MTAETIMAAAAVASLILSGLAALYAYRSSNLASDAIVRAEAANALAAEANAISDAARRVSAAGVAGAQQAARAASVPQVFIAGVSRGGGTGSLTLHLTNQGPGVAFGVIVMAAPVARRDLEAVAPDRWTWSGRRATFPPSGRTTEFAIELDSNQPANVPDTWVALRVEYYSGLGVVTRLDYLYPLEHGSTRFRLHRVTLDYGQPGEVAFPVALGPLGD